MSNTHRIGSHAHAGGSWYSLRLRDGPSESCLSPGDSVAAPSWMARFPAGGLIMKKLPTPGLSMRRLHRPSPKDLCGDPLKVAGSALQSWLLYPPSVPLPIASHSAGAAIAVDLQSRHAQQR